MSDRICFPTVRRLIECFLCGQPETERKLMVNIAGVPVHLDCYLSVQARLDEGCRCKVCASQDNLCAGDIANSVGLTRWED